MQHHVGITASLDRGLRQVHTVLIAGNLGLVGITASLDRGLRLSVSIWYIRANVPSE